MKRTVLAAAAAVFVLSFTAAMAQQAKIGVFEFGRVSQETAEGQRIQKKLREYQEAKQADLAAKEQELKDLNDKLVAQALSLSPERRAAMEKDLQKKQNDLQTAREGAQREWQIEFNEAQSGFQQKVIDVVEAIGREQGYLVILERDQCVFRADAVDITPEVVKRLDQMSPPPAADAGGAAGGGS